MRILENENILKVKVMKFPGGGKNDVSKMFKIQK